MAASAKPSQTSWAAEAIAWAPEPEARKTAALEAQSFVGKNAPRLISEELDRRIGSGDYGEAAGKDKASDAPSNG